MLALGVAVLLGLVGCSSAGSASGDASELAGTGTVASGSIFDSSEAHEVIIDVGQDDLTLMLQTYMDSGDKDWVSATVTMDGTVFENVGIKLKGNSSLRGVTTESAPQDLPWRIKLDKYVSGANLDGYTDFTVRANSTSRDRAAWRRRSAVMSRMLARKMSLSSTWMTEPTRST